MWSYKIYYSKGENSLFDIKSKCNISNKCDHLDCAIYAAEYTAKNNKNHLQVWPRSRETSATIEDFVYFEAVYLVPELISTYALRGKNAQNVLIYRNSK